MTATGKVPDVLAADVGVIRGTLVHLFIHSLVHSMHIYEAPSVDQTLDTRGTAPPLAAGVPVGGERGTDPSVCP